MMSLYKPIGLAQLKNRTGKLFRIKSRGSTKRSRPTLPSPQTRLCRPWCKLAERNFQRYASLRGDSRRTLASQAGFDENPPRASTLKALCHRASILAAIALLSGPILHPPVTVAALEIDETSQAAPSVEPIKEESWMMRLLSDRKALTAPALNGASTGKQMSPQAEAMEAWFEFAMLSLGGPLIGVVIGAFFAGNIVKKRNEGRDQCDPTIARVSLTMLYPRCPSMRAGKASQRSRAAAMDAKTLQQMLQSVGLPPWAGIRDIERPGWANQVIETAWPYLDKATSDAIILSVDPILQDYCPPFLTSIRFDKFTFGSVPATVEGVKVYDTGDEGKVEADIFVVWAGDPEVVLGVRTAGDSVRVPVAVTELQGTACVRLIFSPLLPYFPCFGAISVSLASRPNLDFDLRVVGSDITLVPGVAPQLKKFLKDILTTLLVWPCQIVVPVAGESLKDGILFLDGKPNADPGKLFVRLVGTSGVSALLGGRGDVLGKVSLGTRRSDSSARFMSAEEGSDGEPPAFMDVTFDRHSLVEVPLSCAPAPRTESAGGGVNWTPVWPSEEFELDIADFSTDQLCVALYSRQALSEAEGAAGEDAEDDPLELAFLGELMLSEVLPVPEKDGNGKNGNQAGWAESYTLSVAMDLSPVEKKRARGEAMKEWIYGTARATGAATVDTGRQVGRLVAAVPTAVAAAPGVIGGWISKVQVPWWGSAGEEEEGEAGAEAKEGSSAEAGGQVPQDVASTSFDVGGGKESGNDEAAALGNQELEKSDLQGGKNPTSEEKEAKVRKTAAAVAAAVAAVEAAEAFVASAATAPKPTQLRFELCFVPSGGKKRSAVPLTALSSPLPPSSGRLSDPSAIPTLRTPTANGTTALAATEEDVLVYSLPPSLPPALPAKRVHYPYEAVSDAAVVMQESAQLTANQMRLEEEQRALLQGQQATATPELEPLSAADASTEGLHKDAVEQEEAGVAHADPSSSHVRARKKDALSATVTQLRDVMTAAAEAAAQSRDEEQLKAVEEILERANAMLETASKQMKSNETALRDR
ncbi:hypothetical protein CYMTET_20453 [Cymbomonas tetramitiformis]|uniref:SMP-LTD domain-containing protein n=1 Tax=Cymbomonas tetramitiformis TaxID=36881 RepID=A0AAE0G4I1_9CHLO|nr:hypothetical protein CYMTET_20453 [Cymbomonas tetramitiformis]